MKCSRIDSVFCGNTAEGCPVVEQEFLDCNCKRAFAKRGEHLAYEPCCLDVCDGLDAFGKFGNQRRAGRYTSVNESCRDGFADEVVKIRFEIVVTLGHFSDEV